MKYISYRVHVSYILGAALILLVVSSSASALYVDYADTGAQSPVNIDEVAADGSTPLGTLEIGSGGNASQNSRTDIVIQVP